MKFMQKLFGKNAAPTPDETSPAGGDNEAGPQREAGEASKPRKRKRGGKNRRKSEDAPGQRNEDRGTAPEADDTNSEAVPAEGPFDFDSEFAKLELPDTVNRGIARLGFDACTPVQREVLPHALDGHDIIAQAQTGTGKTAAFLLTLITYHLENPEDSPRGDGTPFALIIAPTRELVMQIASDAEDLAWFTDLSIVTLVGGIDYDRQRRQCQGPVDLIAATPGRLLDFCRQGVVDLSKVEHLVLDEADRMLSMGFIPDVKAIIRRTPYKDKRQTQLFSATFNYDIRQLAESWTSNPHKVVIEPESVAVDTVEQLVYLTSEDHKFDVLYNILKDLERAIVFVNRRDETRHLESLLSRVGVKTGLLSGEVQQRKRIKTLDAFKSGEIKVLVATDVAGRGIHVDNVSHVINYNLPEDPEDYVHRIGRTGRAGADGTSISLACEYESFMLPEIERLLGEPLKCEQPPEDLMEPAPLSAEARRPDRRRRPGGGGGRGGGRSGRPGGGRGGGGGRRRR